jgi:hypothetical protein
VFPSIYTPAVYFIIIVISLDLKLVSEIPSVRAKHLEHHSFIYPSNYTMRTGRLPTL